MHHTDELVTAIDRRLHEARQEIASLKAARAAMNGNRGSTRGAASQSRTTAQESRTTAQDSRTTDRAAANQSRAAAPATATQTVATPSPSPRARRPARRRSRPAAAVVPAGKLEVLLGASADGVSTAALAEQTGGDRHQILTLLRELEADGRIRRTGTARGVRWHLITDEERIAARVAELEAQMKRKAAPAAG